VVAREKIVRIEREEMIEEKENPSEEKEKIKARIQGGMKI